MLNEDAQDKHQIQDNDQEASQPNFDECEIDINKISC